MTERTDSPTPDGADARRSTPTHSRRGVAYAVVAAAMGPPSSSCSILLLGFTIQVVASVAAGEIIAWRSSVDLTYVVLFPFALLSGLLLFIPLRIWRAAARLIGRSRATLWVGSLLAAALAGVAAIWFVQGTCPRPSAHASQPEYWYALAFAVAAVVILLASVLTARGATVAAVAVLGASAAGVLVLGVSLVAVWGSGPRIPADAETVDIIVTSAGVELAPDTVHAGPVYFFAESPGEVSGHGEVSFVSAGYAPRDEAPLPLSEEGIQALTRGDYEGTSIESGWVGYSKLTLREGYYAFVVAGPEGEGPGVAPQSITVLEVRP